MSSTPKGREEAAHRVAEKRAFAQLKRDLMRHPDVVGVATGYRVRKGQATGEKCVTVFVRRKRQRGRIPFRRRIPRFYLGRNADGSSNRRVRVYTDVVQIGRARALADERAGGTRIFVQGRSGTLTFVFADVQRDGEINLLSNRHVFAPRLHAAGSREVATRLDGEVRQIGDLSDFFGFEEEGGAKFFDAALARLRPEVAGAVALRTIVEPGGTYRRITRIRALRDRETGSFWRASEAGIQEGRLWDRLSGGGAWNIEYPHLGERAVHGVYGLRAFASEGDSGAPIYERLEDGTVILVGIVVGVGEDEESGRKITLFHSISDIEKGFRALLKRPTFRFLARE